MLFYVNTPGHDTPASNHRSSPAPFAPFGPAPLPSERPAPQRMQALSVFLEADGVSVHPEALAAHENVVLPDDAGLAGADAALARTLAVLGRVCERKGGHEAVPLLVPL